MSQNAQFDHHKNECVDKDKLTALSAFENVIRLYHISI